MVHVTQAVAPQGRSLRCTLLVSGTQCLHGIVTAGIPHGWQETGADCGIQGCDKGYASHSDMPLGAEA